MHKLKIDEFTIDISKSKISNGAFNLLGKININTLFDKFLPFWKKQNGIITDFVIDDISYKAAPGGIYFDKFGNFELALLTDQYLNEHPAPDGPLSLMTNDVTYNNLKYIVELQDKIIRDFAKINSEFSNLSSVKEYNSSFPTSLRIDRQVPDLKLWMESKEGNNFFNIED